MNWRKRNSTNARICPAIFVMWFRGSIALPLIILCGLLTSPASAKSPAAQLRATLAAQGYESVVLRRTGQNHWFVFGQVEGQRRSCLIDTGWAYTSISRSLAPRLTSTNQIEQLKVGDLVLSHVPVRMVDLQINGQSTGYAVVLGCDFLLAHQALMDFRNARLYLRRQPSSGAQNRALAEALSATGRTAVAVQLQHPPALTAVATIREINTQLLIDSGAMWSCLDSEFARRAKLSSARSIQRIFGPGASGQRSFAVTDLVSWSLGTVTMKGCSAAVLDLSDWGLGVRAKLFPSVEGILGGSELLTTEAWLDCGQLKLWLKSSP